MNKITLVRTSAILNISGAAGLIIWWFLMPAFLPVADATSNFQNMILDDQWIIINLVGLISVVFLALGFPGFYLCKYDKFSKTGFAGMLIASAGLILYACIQYYETLIWPAAVVINQELLETDGALVSGDPGVVAGLMVSGLILAAGYIIFGISALVSRAYPALPVWFLIIGAPVFGNGVIMPVRTAGLILLSAGTIWLANKTIQYK